MISWKPAAVRLGSVVVIAMALVLSPAAHAGDGGHHGNNGGHSGHWGHHHGGGWGWGWTAPALVGGALLGAALAAPYYYGYGYPYAGGGYPYQTYYPPPAPYYPPAPQQRLCPNPYVPGGTVQC